MTDFDDLLGEDSLPIDLRSEKAIQNDGLVALSARPNSIYFRNNTGQAWQGRQVRAKVGGWVKFEEGMVVLRGARPISFGLEGSGDVLGADSGFPVAVEFKDADGRQRKQQILFGEAWERAGGIYVLARTVHEAKNKVGTEVARRLVARKT